MCSWRGLGQRENHLPPGFDLCNWGIGENSLIHFNQEAPVVGRDWRGCRVSREVEVWVWERGSQNLDMAIPPHSIRKLEARLPQDLGELVKSLLAS